jgi:hypothetical protein
MPLTSSINSLRFRAVAPRASVRPVCMAPLSAPPSPEDQKNVRKNKDQVKDFIRRRQGSAKPQPAPSNPPMPLTSSINSLRFRAVTEQQQLSSLFQQLSVLGGRPAV